MRGTFARNLAIGALLAAAVLALALAVRPRTPPARATQDRAATATVGLSELWRMPEFSFLDQNERATTSADLRGRVYVANFIFTRCTTICPVITAKMALLQRRLQSSELRFVSFSVDPEHDRPSVLRHYAAQWRPGEMRWILLATTKESLEQIASRMHVRVRPTDTDILHTNLFFLVDGRGIVRGIYESDKNDAIERLVHDAETLSQAARVGAPSRDRALAGRELYASLGCDGCHARHDVAPPLKGLLNRSVRLEAETELVADRAYIRRSIVTPDAERVLGYPLRMPSYKTELAPHELDALVEHIAELRAEDTSRPRSEQRPVSASPDRSATDPVCAMSVRVSEKTPQAAHEGRTHYFCSEPCRDRFRADPARYTRR